MTQLTALRVSGPGKWGYNDEKTVEFSQNVNDALRGIDHTEISRVQLALASLGLVIGEDDEFDMLVGPEGKSRVTLLRDREGKLRGHLTPSLERI